MSAIPNQSSTRDGMLSGRAARAGALAGLAGGIIFAMMMAMMMPPMLGMIGGLIGAPSLGVLVHGLFSAIIGASFGLLLGSRVCDWRTGGMLGAGYGVVWWVLGPLLIMPIWMGMGPMFSQAFATPNMMSLVGHVIFGVVMGLVYRALTR